MVFFFNKKGEGLKLFDVGSLPQNASVAFNAIHEGVFTEFNNRGVDYTLRILKRAGKNFSATSAHRLRFFSSGNTAFKTPGCPYEYFIRGGERELFLNNLAD